MPQDRLTERIEAIRSFNRFFTRKIGVLREGLLHSPHPLTEARIIFELAQHTDLTARTLERELGLDAGYLSRTLGKLETQGLVERHRDETDGRQRRLRLTPAGLEVFKLLDQRAREEVADLLEGMPEADQRQLLQAMRTIQSTLGEPFKFSQPFVLRPHEPGDIGWVVQRHAALYTQEYGWDSSFEALVAKIGAEFLERFEPKRERCWIAEMGGERVGSVFCVQRDERTAKLRLLLVEPQARGLGLGKALVQECIRFAKRCGYTRLILWTNSILLEARGIYVKLGFQLEHAEPHHSFGHDLIGETWTLEL